MVSVYVMRKVRRLTIPNIFTSIRAIFGLSVPLWWQEGSFATYIILGAVIMSAWIAWISEYNQRQLAPLSRALSPLADKFFILPILWFVGITTGDAALIILAAYTTLYDIVSTWQRRVAMSLAWQGITLLYLPTTVLSRVKTVLQYLFVIMLAFPAAHGLPVTVMTVSLMVMTVVAWSSHRSVTLL